jgi:hypothetical protein
MAQIEMPPVRIFFDLRTALKEPAHLVLPNCWHHARNRAQVGGPEGPLEH